MFLPWYSVSLRIRSYAELASSVAYGAFVALAGGITAIAGALLTAPREARRGHRAAAAAASRLPAPDRQA